MAHIRPPIQGDHARFKRWRQAVSASLVTALCWGAACTTAAPSNPPSVAMSQITQITLERNCFGCATGSVLVLRRDGTAQLTQTGNARSGTADQRLRGSVTTAEFDALARLLVGRGYFSFDDSYQDPALQDGPWTTTAVLRLGPGQAQEKHEKRVFRRDDAGPAALREIESAIDAVKSRIAFVPDAR